MSRGRSRAVRVPYSEIRIVRSQYIHFILRPKYDSQWSAQVKLWTFSHDKAAVGKVLKQTATLGEEHRDIPVVACALRHIYFTYSRFFVP